MLDIKKCDERSPVEVRFCVALSCFDKWLSERGCETRQQWTPPGLPPRTVFGGVAVDFAITHPRGMFVIEIDGYEYHSTEDQKQRDTKRAARIEAVGCVVLRFTGSDVFQDAAWCVYQTVEQVIDRLGIVKDADFWAANENVKNLYSKEVWLNSPKGQVWKQKKEAENAEMYCLIKRLVENQPIAVLQPKPTSFCLISNSKVEIALETAILRKMTCNCGKEIRIKPLMEDGRCVVAIPRHKPVVKLA